MAGKRHFTPEFFAFLTELKENNNREWFQANKDRYRTDVQEPLLRFISDFSGRLGDISSNFIADPRPSGGSMFRIYRDVRFSKDKSPYKTHAAAQFRHRAGRDVHAPGFYLHLETGGIFAGAGLWHPDRTALDQIRTAIVERPEEWRAVLGDAGFAKHHELSGESLKRAPRGYDPEHPLIEDLKRKDYVSVRRFTQKQAMSATFLDTFADSCRAAGPFVRFLTEAIGQPF
jgi:uncharacterized protein (TIGR02453 family)